MRSHDALTWIDVVLCTWSSLSLSSCCFILSQSSLYPIIVGQYYGISLCIAESLILVYLGQCDNTRGAICVVSSVAFTVEFTLELWLVEDYEHYTCRKQLNLPLIGLLEYALFSLPHVLQMLPWIPKLWQSALWFVHHISLTDLSIVIMHVHGGITVPMGSEFNISNGEWLFFLMCAWGWEAWVYGRTLLPLQNSSAACS